MTTTRTADEIVRALAATCPLTGRTGRNYKGNAWACILCETEGDHLDDFPHADNCPHALAVAYVEASK